MGDVVYPSVWNKEAELNARQEQVEPIFIMIDEPLRAEAMLHYMPERLIDDVRYLSDKNEDVKKVNARVNAARQRLPEMLLLKPPQKKSVVDYQREIRPHSLREICDEISVSTPENWRGTPTYYTALMREFLVRMYQIYHFFNATTQSLS